MPFSKQKFVQSMIRSGAERKLALTIAEEVLQTAYDGISTKEIYRIGFERLRKHSGHLAARYQLKTAIMELGPSGFPFEKFIGEILKRMGYAVQVGVIVKGKCVNHEIDVIAEKDEQHFMIECKYHNHRGTVSGVKIPLYIQSRFLDVQSTWVKLAGHADKFHQGWLVTNTRFTGDAIQYGTCIGLNLIGWDYPAKGNLKGLIDSLGLYPITCLTTLRSAEKTFLLNNNIVLCKEVCKNPDWLKSAGISAERINKILEEGRLLCKNSNDHGAH